MRSDLSLLILTLHYLFHNCHENRRRKVTGHSLFMALHYHSYNCHEKEEEWWQVITCKQLLWHFITILVTVMRIVKQVRDVVTSRSSFWHFITILITVMRIKKSGDRSFLILTLHSSFWHFITYFITVMRIKRCDNRWFLVLTLHYHSHNCHENSETRKRRE